MGKGRSQRLEMKIKLVCLLVRWQDKAYEFPTRTRSRSRGNVADTKLEKTSLSADVSLWFS